MDHFDPLYSDTFSQRYYINDVNFKNKSGAESSFIGTMYIVKGLMLVLTPSCSASHAFIGSTNDSCRLHFSILGSKVWCEVLFSLSTVE